MWKNIKSWLKPSTPTIKTKEAPPTTEHKYFKQEIFEFEGFPNDIPRVGVVALANGILKDCCRVLDSTGVDHVTASLILHLAYQNQNANVLVQHYIRNNMVYVITYVRNKGYQKVHLYPQDGELCGFNEISQP